MMDKQHIYRQGSVRVPVILCASVCTRPAVSVSMIYIYINTHADVFVCASV